jgi:hypothetical protein
MILTWIWMISLWILKVKKIFKITFFNSHENYNNYFNFNYIFKPQFL